MEKKKKREAGALNMREIIVRHNNGNMLSIHMFDWLPYSGAGDFRWRGLEAFLQVYGVRYPTILISDPP